MRFGLDVAQHRLTWAELLHRVRLAEELGFDGVWLFDHFKPMYGSGPGPCMEGMTLLAALAARTERIRLGLLVTGITYRHPSVLAAEAVTIDNVSGGRLELALGAAWFEQEHRELGIPFPPLGERIDLLEDTLDVVTLLMSGERVSFSGRRVTLREAQLLPRPAQLPHPPIWIGASGERRMLPLVARHADAWHSFGSLADLRRKSELVSRLAVDAGRDPDRILRASSLSIDDLGEARRQAAELRDAGFGYLVCGWPPAGGEQVEAFATQVVRELG